MAEATGLRTVYKDVFDLPEVPAFRTFYSFQIFPAKYIYRGFYNAWHVVNAPTVKNPDATRHLFRTNTAKAVCAELAGLVWSEGAEINVSRKGVDSEDDPLQQYVNAVLDENGFPEKWQEFIEQMAALGGVAIKGFVKMRHDSEGNPIPGTEHVVLDYCMADQFVPTEWTNSGVRAGIFVSRKAIDGYYYTRLERHWWDGDTYVISNDLYRAEIREGEQNQDILGIWYPLDLIYPDLEREVRLEGLTEPLFTYIRTPIANNVDDNSPLGVSIYANAYDTLHGIDIVFDSLIREVRLGKRRIIVPAAAVKVTADPQTGVMRRYFDPNDEAYEALTIDDIDSLKVQNEAAQLRIADHVSAMNTLLSELCLQLGFSAGSFSFDLHTGLKTATEVISENSKTYKTIKTMQDQLIPGMQDIVRIILTLAQLYKIEYQGQSIERLTANGWDCSVVMEDAVLEDNQMKIARGINLVASGLLSKTTFLTSPKYGICMTQEEAEAELQRIKSESAVTATALDIFQTGTLE